MSIFSAHLLKSRVVLIYFVTNSNCSKIFILSSKLKLKMKSFLGSLSCKKTSPPDGPVYCPPCPPWGSKKILGGFWHLSQLKFEEISPKIPRMQILRKLAPLLVPFTVPPVPPGGQKNFWEVSGI